MSTSYLEHVHKNLTGSCWRNTKTMMCGSLTSLTPAPLCCVRFVSLSQWSDWEQLETVMLSSVFSHPESEPSRTDSRSETTLERKSFTALLLHGNKIPATRMLGFLSVTLDISSCQMLIDNSWDLSGDRLRCAPALTSSAVEAGEAEEPPCSHFPFFYQQWCYGYGLHVLICNLKPVFCDTNCLMNFWARGKSG